MKLVYIINILILVLLIVMFDVNGADSLMIVIVVVDCCWLLLIVVDCCW